MLMYFTYVALAKFCSHQATLLLFLNYFVSQSAIQQKSI